MGLASPEEVRKFIADNPVWKLDGQTLVAEFIFKNFNESMGFVTRVALSAERAGHHPHIDIRWNRVRLVLSTHSEGGITGKDFDLAAHIAGFV